MKTITRQNEWSSPLAVLPEDFQAIGHVLISQYCDSGGQMDYHCSASNSHIN